MSQHNLKMFKKYLVFNLFLILNYVCGKQVRINAGFSKIWGPGLEPHIFTMPARYFFIQTVDSFKNNITSNLDVAFKISFDGFTNSKKPCRIWTNQLNRQDGSFIIRYKLYEPCFDMKIFIEYENEQVDKSPYIIPEPVYSDDCDCANVQIEQFLENWKCGAVPKQVTNDLRTFQSIDWGKSRQEIIKKFNQPHSVSLCHYIIKNNVIYRNCYGKYVGFKMFMDNILLSLSRKLILPDIEFFVNLGDWPLVKQNEKFPIFSWCGSTNTMDIILPTYDITESSLENMGRVMLDMLSVQGNVGVPWEKRIEKAFWRGRDSNKHRLELITISKNFPDLFNVSMTNFFFYRDQQDVYGPKTEHVSFFKFFEYKYQLAIDGTVAAYRFPYLLAGGSLVIKQESQYYEHFYNDLIPNIYYVEVNRNLSNLVEILQWAKENDEEVQKIAQNGQQFANEFLLPQDIYCYHAQLINEFSKRIKSEIHIIEGMEKVEQSKQQNYCNCKIVIKDEL